MIIEKPKFYSNHRGRVKSLDCYENNLDLNKYNKNEENLLDIGFGNGESIKYFCQKTEKNIFAIDSYSIGIKKIKDYIDKNKIPNVHIFKGDAVEILEFFPDRFFNKINIFFPDPWPKKKHHKRRIINEYFLNLLKEKTKEKNIIHISTDHINYGLYIKAQIEKNFKIELKFSPNRGARPITKFEEKALSKKRIILDLIFNL